MVKHILCSLVVGMGMMETPTYGQSLFSPRAIGLGAYGPLVNDTRSFTDNVSGIVNMKDWDLTIATYLNNIHSNQGFTFEGLSLGKRFLERFAVALQYSPGTSMAFVIPPTLTLAGPTPTSVDQQISYEEPFAAGFGWRIIHALSLGLDTRYRDEKITDTQYELVQRDTGFSIQRLPDVQHAIRSWTFDLGMQWKPAGGMTVSVVGRNLVNSESGSFPDQFDQYRITNDRVLDVGIACDVTHSLVVSGEYATSSNGSLGIEWRPGFDMALRGGMYVSQLESPFLYAVGMGIGWSYIFFDADVSYLAFLRQNDRQGTSSVNAFDAAAFNSIDLNRYSSDRLQLSLKAMFGMIRTSLASIEGVEIKGGIYPSEFEALAYRPLGTVRVKNTSDKPIEARARFYIEKYMDDPTESQPVYILPGEVREIPLTAVFNSRVKDVERMIVSEGNVYVSATPADEYDDTYATPVLIHGKNDWDGNVFSLRYFVTPDDPAIIRYTRDVLLAYKDSLTTVSRELETFRKANILFDTFAGKLVYVNDPRQSADYVQYPSETLQLRGGDCDDMTTCFSSLLNSIGVSTAFVDVIPPDDSSRSHVYLMFDTGIEPRYGNAISMNAKRYVIRKSPKGVETIWIPIETTVITRGFDAAWSQGAQEYYDDVEVGLGLIKGWVKIVDVY